MSSSFKFLNNSSAESDSDKNKSFEQEDAAQSFLDKKLDKNKFTIAQEGTGSKYESLYTEEQQKRLDENGGPTVGTASGDNPGKGTGNLAERYKEEFGSDAMSDIAAVGGNTNAANAIFANIRSLDGDDFWKKQDLTDLMTKAGHAETDGIRAGDTAERGGMQVPATLMDGINYEPIRGALAEKGWDTDAVKQNGFGQMASSMLQAGGDGDGNGVELSPEIEQAKERVKTYEDDALSGKTSADIYGGNPGSKYELDLNKGADGIGTPQVSSAKQATASFLDNKKSQVKNKFQFEAQS